jgi:4-aminobutyrate aminotransferase-like enzyme
VTESPVWHPFTQHGLGEPIPLVTHAEGAALYIADGRRIVDAISSWWVTTLGHRHPRIMAAIAGNRALSPEFYWFHDDMYVINPVTEIPRLWRTTWPEWEAGAREGLSIAEART